MAGQGGIFPVSEAGCIDHLRDGRTRDSLELIKKPPLDGVFPVRVPVLQPWPASKVIVRCQGRIQTKNMFEFTKAMLHGEVGNIPVLCFC